MWDFTEVRTADGHFDDHMKWLATQRKAQEEAFQQAGVISGTSCSWRSIRAKAT